MKQTYLRGELYYADLGKGVGSEQNGYCPVVIIQNDVGNKFSPTTIVAPVTTDHDSKAKLPTHCHIGEENGLEAPSVILLEQIRTIEKMRLTSYVGRLDNGQIRRLNYALAVSVGLNESDENQIQICLCSTCARQFACMGVFSLDQRIRGQKAMELCSACGQRPGVDYTMILRKRGTLP